jgi:MSHA biogenesis protein MshL
VLKIGTDEFYVTGVSTTTTTSGSGTGTSPTVTLQPFFSGVVLDVTPQIDEDGNIILHVHPSVSQVSTVNKGLNLGSLGNFTCRWRRRRLRKWTAWCAARTARWWRSAA